MNGIGRSTLIAMSGLMYTQRLSFTAPTGQVLPEIRVRVVDPDTVGRRAAEAAFATSQRVGVPYADVRLVYLHPQDGIPPMGSRVKVNGGTLELVDRSMPSAATGASILTAVMRR